MPAMGTPPPSLSGIIFVLFAILLLIAAPIALAAWLLWLLPWQASAAAIVALVIGYKIRKRKKRA